MPQLTWLGDAQAKQTAHQMPYRLLETVSQHGDASTKNWLIRGDVEIWSRMAKTRKLWLKERSNDRVVQTSTCGRDKNDVKYCRCESVLSKLQGFFKV